MVFTTCKAGTGEYSCHGAVGVVMVAATALALKVLGCRSCLVQSPFPDGYPDFGSSIGFPSQPITPPSHPQSHDLVVSHGRERQ